MAMNFGVLILAFVFFASVALGAATAWGLYAYSRRRWVWLLTPVFAVLWLLLGTVPFLFLSYDRVARPAPVIAPAPTVTPPTQEPEEELITEAPEEAR